MILLKDIMLTNYVNFVVSLIRIILSIAILMAAKLPMPVGDMWSMVVVVTEWDVMALLWSISGFVVVLLAVGL